MPRDRRGTEWRDASPVGERGGRDVGRIRDPETMENIMAASPSTRLMGLVGLGVVAYMECLFNRQHILEMVVSGCHPWSARVTSPATDLQ